MLFCQWRSFGSKSAPTCCISEIFAWIVQPSGDIYFKSLPLPPAINPKKDFDQGLEDAPNDPLLPIEMAFHGTLDRGVVDRLVKSPSPILEVQHPDAMGLLRTFNKILIEPLEPYLPTDPENNIVIIPDRSLFDFPFNSFLDDNGHYLIERHTLSVAPVFPGTCASL